MPRPALLRAALGAVLVAASATGFAQQVEVEEFSLPNGM